MSLNIEMILIAVATLVLSVLCQRNPNFFEKQDYEYRDLPQRSQFSGGNTKMFENPYRDWTNPYQFRDLPRTRRPYQGPNSKAKEEKIIEDKLSKIDPAIFEELDQQLLKYNKYDEFKQLTDFIKEKSRKDPSRTIQDEVMEALQWARNLDKPYFQKRRLQLQPGASNSYKNQKLSNAVPSPGMNAYWAPQQKKSLPPNLGANNQQTLTGRQVMSLALQKLESIDAIGKKSPMEKFPEVMNSLPKSLPTDLLQVPKEMRSSNNPNIWQKVDDFNSPVRWVTIDSNDTGDGLAKVTDPRTGRNQQYILNGSVFVPIIDYNIERLGLTSTTHSPVLTTDKRVLRTVQESVNFNNVDERDWLAFQTVLGDRNESNQCDGDNCQSRCKTLACESVCTGDTCASGCIGGHCNAFCKGPGCLSMCIGDSCTTKCEGLACDARCRGKNCEAGCRTFSCTYTINGQSGRGGASWGEHYPQYEDRNIRNTQY